MDITQIFNFVDSFIKSGYLRLIAQSPVFQFGTEEQPLHFARLLPVVPKDSNTIVEEVIRMGAGFVANDGSPLSPPQIKSVPVAGQGLTITLSHLDIAVQITGEEMTQLGKLINNGSDRAIGEQFLARLFTERVRMALEKKTEIQRIQALVTGDVTVTPMNALPFTIPFPKPSGHRFTVPSGTVAAPAGWYSPAFNPFTNTLTPTKQMLNQKGRIIKEIWTSSRIMGALQMNPTIQAMGGSVAFYLNAAGQVTPVGYQTSELAVKNAFAANGFPAPMLYDEFYEMQDGSSSRYFPEDIFLMVCGTTRTIPVDITDNTGRILKQELIGSTLGYTGEGINIGSSSSGITITVKTQDLKPVGIYTEGYCNRFPVFLDHDSIVAIKIPAPTA